MYQPRRTERFHYLWEVMDFIERNQCGSCAFKSDREDYAMCFEVEAELIEEKPVADLDEKSDGSVVCLKYRNDVLAEESAPEQERLFDV